MEHRAPGFCSEVCPASFGRAPAPGPDVALAPRDAARAEATRRTPSGPLWRRSRVCEQTHQALPLWHPRHRQQIREPREVDILTTDMCSRSPSSTFRGLLTMSALSMHPRIVSLLLCIPCFLPPSAVGAFLVVRFDRICGLGMLGHSPAAELADIQQAEPWTIAPQ